MDTQQNNEIKQEVKSLNYFKIHFSAYVVIIASLWIVCLAAFHSTPSWLFYISFGWGIILVIHFIAVYLLFPKNKG